MSDVTADAIREVERLTSQAIKTTVLKVDQEPADVYYLVGPDGKALKQSAAPRWHNENLAAPGELGRFIKDRADNAGAMTFIGDDKIVFVYEQDKRRDQASVVLTKSPQYHWLEKESGGQLTHIALVRLLRITFKGCMMSENALTLLRTLKFDSTGGVNSDQQNSRASMGKQIMAQVTGQADVPEELGFSIPVFENHPFRAQVLCALEMFPSEATFKVTPYPMQVRGAFDSVMEDLLHCFTGNDMPPVYLGKP